MTHFAFPAKVAFAFEFFLAFFECLNQLAIDALFLDNFLKIQFFSDLSRRQLDIYLFGFDFLVTKFTTPAIVARAGTRPFGLLNLSIDTLF